MKHTPVSWKAWLDLGGIVHAGHVTLGTGIGAYSKDTERGTKRWANACLIAAAPELLEALEQCVNELQVAASSGQSRGHAWFDRRIKRWSPIVRKAKGEI